MRGVWRRWIGRAAFVALAAAALVNAGCIAAAVVGAAAGGAAVGYAYWSAPLVREYPAGLPDAVTATKVALADLQFPLLKEQPDGGGVILDSRTGNDVKVRILIDVVNSPVPVDGSVTRVAVRVGAFGDDAISKRIQDQIAQHMPQPRQAPVPVPVSVPVPSGAPPAESPPPPLAVDPVKRDRR
jgi:hypothetical protein